MIALHVLNKDIISFGSFGVEHIIKKKLLLGKSIKAILFRIQANNSIMCGYFCIEFIDFVLAGKTLTEYTSLFFLMILKKRLYNSELF